MVIEELTFEEIILIFKIRENELYLSKVKISNKRIR
jgi:hypothetical protein